MKTIIQYVVYWGALLQLRSLQINLQGMYDSTASVVCTDTLAATDQSIKNLSLEVINARNRANALRPVRRLTSWRAMA